MNYSAQEQFEQWLSGKREFWALDLQAMKMARDYLAGLHRRERVG